MTSLDITFSGSDAIWTQHTSGAFMQFDLREVTRPLDAIPRAAISWEATGSMAFIVDKKEPWEVPFDDMQVLLFRVTRFLKTPALYLAVPKHASMQKAKNQLTKLWVMPEQKSPRRLPPPAPTSF